MSNGDSVSLTKAAVIYGANASGKSNIIYALWELRKMIIQADSIKIDEPLSSYKPFLFNPTSAHAPIDFEIIFIAKNSEKYRYQISFNEDEIIKEELFYYPKKHAKTLFTRTNEKNGKDENVHSGRLGKEFNYKQYEVHKKLPLLSIFGNASNYHPNISPVHTYFKDLEVYNVVNQRLVNNLSDQIKSDLQKEEYKWLELQLERLIRACDTQINGIQIDKESKVRHFEHQEEEKVIRVSRKEILFAQHKMYVDQKETGDLYALPFNEESIGTNHLFALGGLILKALKEGKVVFFDELDSSLHPYISRFLLKLFLTPASNPKNAQLIFTAHEPNLMDKNKLRADQIWFTQKTPEGATEFFSAQDFDGVREDIPFDKWYMEGKFGAVPHISEIEYIFGNGKTEN
jgi:AAA15 family ATPase/GTPase